MEAGEPTQVKIILADDHPLIRAALREVLEREPGFEVIGEAGTGAEAVELTAELQPDVVIMDISMPVMNGVEATRQIKSANPLTLVLILTVHTDTNTIFSILQAGASGYLIKSVFGPEVVRTLHALMDGDLVLGPGVSQELFKHTLRHVEDGVPPIRPAPREGISAKGKEILTLAAQGMSNKEIGARLGISEATVKGHLVEVFGALNVRSRTEAVFVSLKSGLIHLDELG